MTKENKVEATKAPIPSWIKAEIFINVLKKIVPDFVSIKSFEVQPGTAAGENYASIMLRTDIVANLKDDQSKLVSFMLKIPHDGEVFKSMSERHNVFKAETFMYTDVLPEFQQLYADAGLDIKFGAESYNIEAPDEYVLLQNLSNKGFKNANRLEGLDADHVHCVLKKLAQWHAASAVRVVTKGPYPANISEGFLQEGNKDVFKEMVKSLGQSFLKCLPTYNGNEAYSQKVIRLQGQIADKYIQIAKTDPNVFNVLNHGDCWSNNIMFQYDEFGKIKETYFVDYQISKYGPPAHDLLYFLLSSVKFEDKLSKFDANIKYYHDHLVEYLKLLKYPKAIPSLVDIHISLLKYGVSGYFIATGVMAGTLVDPTDSASLENFLSETAEGNHFKMLLYSNKRYRRHIEAVLPWLLNRGALD